MTQIENLKILLSAALAHHQAGRLAEAEPLYRQALAIDPNQPDALQLLGIAYHQAGQSAQGAQLIGRSVAIAPSANNLSNLGEVLRSLGRAAEGVQYLQRAVQLDPNHADALGNLGLALLELGRFAEAEQCYRRASELAPKQTDFHVRLCAVRRQLHDHPGAIQAGERAVELEPQSSHTWANLALALLSAKKLEPAESAASRAIEISPKRADAYVIRGDIHAAASQFEKAGQDFRKAIELDPNFHVGHRSLAALLDRRGDYAQSIESLNRSLALHPNDVGGWMNLSIMHRKLGNYHAAVEAGDKAVELEPNNPETHGNIGFALLSVGDFARGLKEYEWRWRCTTFTTKPRDMEGAMWDGSDPAGRTILVHCEQGFGDTIQFARYVPMIVDRGARVVCETWDKLRTLMMTVRGIEKVVVTGIKPPPYDLHIPMLSLPRIFKADRGTIPLQVPYFNIDPARIAHWKSRLESFGAGVRVGLVWAGNTTPDPSRTCPIANLAPLARVKGVRFFSLQKRENQHAMEPPPPGLEMVDLAPELKDFVESAAAMTNLDLIITIDTASAHLAGAMGRPAFVMLPFSPDWRWLNGESDSCLWYSTSRLFRQPARDDWTPVVERVTQALEEFVAHRA